jgi:hypothetical protein
MRVNRLSHVGACSFSVAYNCDKRLSRYIESCLFCWRV